MYAHMVGAPVSATLLAASMAASTSLRPLAAMVRVALAVAVSRELPTQQGKGGREAGRKRECVCPSACENEFSEGGCDLSLSIRLRFVARTSHPPSASGSSRSEGTKSRRRHGLRRWRAARGMGMWWRQKRLI